MFDDEGVGTNPQGDEPEGYPRSRQRAADRPDPHDEATDVERHLSEVVRYIARQLVDEPDAVEVSSRSRNQTVALNLRVADGELGKVIGRQGRTARAIRTAVQIAGAHHDVRVSLDIEG